MKWVKKQLKLVDYYINRLTRLYAEEYKKTLQEVASLVLELYAKVSVDGKPLLSHLYQFKRYYKLSKDIQAKLTELGIRQENIFRKEIVDYYRKNVEILEDQFERPFSITDERIKELVEQSLIDNAQWSESIWKDKAILLNKVRHELVMHIATGKTVDQMAEALQPETLTTNFYNAKRLVRTEIVKYYSDSTLSRYKDMGITEVQRHCVDDNRTCEECHKNNNKIYKIDKADGVIPAHPNCRDWWTPVI